MNVSQKHETLEITLAECNDFSAYDISSILNSVIIPMARLSAQHCLCI